MRKRFELVIEGEWVDPLEGVREGFIGIRNGVIEAISEGKLEGVRKILLGEQEIVFPGFIDPHVHLREPGWEDKEDFLTGTQAAAKGGVTAVLDMPNNRIPTVSRERVLEKMGLSKKSLIDVFFLGGVWDGKEIGKMGSLVKGYKAYMGRTTGHLLLGKDDFEKLGGILGKAGKPVVFHVREPEEEGIREAEELGERYGFPVHIAHISSEAGLRKIKKASCEVAPHHLLFTEKDMEKNPFLTMKPPLGNEKDKKALLDGIKEGKIKMLATDHGPHLPAEKESGAFGLPGLEAYGNVVCWLIEEGIDKKLLAGLTSYNAANLFSLEKRGRIKEGFFADMAVLALEREEVIKKPFRSKCGWSPYEGMAFPGGIKHTIFRGKLLD
ncbi:MAG: dihydroorotase family protein [Candidatus Aenigmarchaeota archaeon]|nr:dihydroorotase family protein [Candidatus Aenigmarchaeota archaeon]